MKIKVYQYIARKLNQIENLRSNPLLRESVYSPDVELLELEQWVRKNGPSGSGIDDGTRLENSSSNRIALKTSFHHMNENGFYDGWTNHILIVKPDLALGFDLHITGQDRNQIKDYLGDVYTTWLNEEVEQ